MQSQTEYLTELETEPLLSYQEIKEIVTEWQERFYQKLQEINSKSFNKNEVTS